MNKESINALMQSLMESVRYDLLVEVRDEVIRRYDMYLNLYCSSCDDRYVDETLRETRGKMCALAELTAYLDGLIYKTDIKKGA